MYVNYVTPRQKMISAKRAECSASMCGALERNLVQTVRMMRLALPHMKAGRELR